MEVAEKLRATRALLERALGVSDAERAWLLALAWGELQESAAALERASAVAPGVPEREAVVPGALQFVC
jgi:hypothetical protein